MSYYKDPSPYDRGPPLSERPQIDPLRKITFHPGTNRAVC